MHENLALEGGSIDHEDKDNDALSVVYNKSNKSAYPVTKQYQRQNSNL